MNLEWLKQHLELPNGLPSHDTVGRVLERVNPLAFQKCFSLWLDSLIGDEKVRLLNIDGKTLRRSHDRKKKLGPLHLVSVWASEQVASTHRRISFDSFPAKTGHVQRNVIHKY